MPYGHTYPEEVRCTDCVNCVDQGECALSQNQDTPRHDAAFAVWVSSNDELEPASIIARDGVVGTEWF